ncbi:sensor histidine kinase [Kaistia algarum]|uniref:sensor histidine kinase n=1 Tax=Kaistia algarum TaxID=2083279 RepID=UPI000CE7F944|nr:HAMP domain-containing sensor histidine kinase [Kaistia algarum]MCX5515333.1 ATP-binding protein [Kaistia algarum]PPE77868.1 sensor histidine kinase [Kaistia algarum]
MKSGSIRFRLWSAAAISVLIALAIAGIGLRMLFERHVERRVVSELTVDLNQLIGATQFGPDTRIVVAPVLTDPRFQSPLSGYYWQVRDGTNGMLVRSRSLWDQALDLPPAEPGDGALHVHEAAGPEGAQLIAVERTITDAGGRSFHAVVAEDHGAVTLAVSEYVRELTPELALLGGVLIAAIFVQISVGLAPLQALRGAVHDVVARRKTRLDVAVPSEVTPLADEINRLLEAQDKALARARTRATDLAHGLKTPLQVLAADIRALRAKGESELADEIGKSTAAIRRHVERELARARIAPGDSGPAQCRFADVAGRVVAVVERMPGGERLTFDIDAAGDLMAPIDEGDLSEILGNLIENAARFAATSIRIVATLTTEGVRIEIADDGPGIADKDKEDVLLRGVRLDESSGTGLGLAIVSDIVGAYGGRLTMGDATPGLKVSIVLPRHS